MSKGNHGAVRVVKGKQCNMGGLRQPGFLYTPKYAVKASSGSAYLWLQFAHMRQLLFLRNASV